MLAVDQTVEDVLCRAKYRQRCGKLLEKARFENGDFLLKCDL